jgi:hypothetical protein
LAISAHCALRFIHGGKNGPTDFTDGEKALTEIESEWKRLQEHIRTTAESGTNDYVCTPSGSLQLEQVRLCAVAAGSGNTRSYLPVCRL